MPLDILETGLPFVVDGLSRSVSVVYGLWHRETSLKYVCESDCFGQLPPWWTTSLLHLFEIRI